MRSHKAVRLAYTRGLSEMNEELNIQKIRLAIDQYKNGKRPPNFGKNFEWYIVDDQSLELFPLKAIYALSLNTSTTSFTTGQAAAKFEKLNIECINIPNELQHKHDEQTGNKPKGNTNPSKVAIEVEIFIRDDEIKTWAKQQANGKCQLCDLPAPFEDKYGTPFLEVHHIQHLSEKGPDTTENVVALCPNCHKAAHFSKDKTNIKKQLLLIKGLS